MSFITYYHKDYSWGLNDSSSPLEIKREQASVLRNWDITYKGKLVQRDGLTVVGNSMGSNPVTGLGAYLRDSGKDILAIEGTNLRFLDSNIWTQLADNLVSGKLFAMQNVQVLGKMYFCNEDNSFRYWDRAGTILNTCITDLGVLAPHGNVMRWHKNHMFHLNNVDMNGTKYPNRICWSALGDPETYDMVNDFFEIPGEGRAITALDLGDNLVIFKERAIQYLSGWGDDSWRVTGSSSNVANIDEQVGIAGLNAACRVGNEIWFIDDQGQIRRIYQTDFDAFRKDIISKNIQGTLSRVNKAQLSKALIWSNNNKVYAAFPNGTDNTNSIICVFDLIASLRTQDEAWTTYTGWTPNLFMDYITTTTPDLYVASATTGKVYRHTGIDDDGVAVDAVYEGKDDDFEKSDRFKRYAFGYFNGDSTIGASDIDFGASVDQSPVARLLQLAVETTGSRLGPTGTFRLGPTGDNRLGSGSTRASDSRYYFDAGGLTPSGKLVRVSITHNVLGQRAIANTYTLNYMLRQLR